MAANNVAPEVIAAITAAVQATTGNKVVAVSVNPAEVWPRAHRSRR